MLKRCIFLVADSHIRNVKYDKSQLNYCHALQFKPAIMHLRYKISPGLQSINCCSAGLFTFPSESRSYLAQTTYVTCIMHEKYDTVATDNFLV